MCLWDTANLVGPGPEERPSEPPRCVSVLALKHEGGDSREDGIDAEVLSIVPSADGTALFCGLARRPRWKSGPAARRHRVA